MCFDFFLNTTNNNYFNNKIRLIINLYSLTEDINVLYNEYLTLRDSKLDYKILAFYIEKNEDKLLIDESFLNYSNAQASLNIINLINLDINKSNCTIIAHEFSDYIYNIVKKNKIKTKIKLFTTY